MILKAMTVVAAVHLVAAPVAAASLEPIEPGPARTGAFAGARLRVAFGGRENGQVRAGLGIAPLRTAQFTDGRVTTRIGESFEIRPSDTGGLALAAGGRVLGPRLGADETREKKRGVPTWALIVGGTVVVLGVAGAVLLDYLGDQSE